MTPLKRPEGMPVNSAHLPICGIVAVAYAAGVSYPEARLAIAKHRPKGNDRRWVGRTYAVERALALLDLGCLVRRRVGWEGCTRKHFMAVYPRGVGERLFIVTAGKHVMVLHGNMVYDNTIAAEGMVRFGRNKGGLEDVLEVVNLGFSDSADDLRRAYEGVDF